jgi:hypothetical protein
MRRTLLFFSLAISASLLLSCVTTTPHVVVTVELFDSRARLPQAADATSLPWEAPVIASSVGDVSVPVAKDIARGSEPQPASKVRPAPIAKSPFDAALASPVRPRQNLIFPLAAPVAPPPQPPRAAAAPATAARQAQPARKAQLSGAAAEAPAGTPAAGGAGGAGGGATTGATSGAAAGGTAQGAGTQPGSSSSPADSYGRLREIFARQGDEVQVGLDGAGFLFLGFPDRSPQADGMAFKGKENRNNKTWFTFKALKLGIYDLDFLQQQNTTGTSAKETVRVHVVSDADFSAAVNQKPEEVPPGTGSAETGDPAFAERLTSLGQYEAAVGELLKGYKEGNPRLNDQIASLYMRMHSYDAAGKYFAKNLAPQGAFSSRAVLGLVQVAVAQKDQQLLMTYLKPFLAIRDPLAEEPLIQAVRMEREKSEIGVGMDLAAEYAARFSSGTWIDEAQFLLAQFLEADSPFRDIARSRDTYRELLSTHPESAYANPARERLRYIERHFYQVR